MERCGRSPIPERQERRLRATSFNVCARRRLVGRETFEMTVQEPALIRLRLPAYSLEQALFFKEGQIGWAGSSPWSSTAVLIT